MQEKKRNQWMKGRWKINLKTFITDLFFIAYLKMYKIGWNSEMVYITEGNAIIFTFP